jgi:hypothetical protein
MLEGSARGSSSYSYERGEKNLYPGFGTPHPTRSQLQVNYRKRMAVQSSVYRRGHRQLSSFVEEQDRSYTLTRLPVDVVRP